MQFTSEKRLDDGVIERAFTLGEIPGMLWTPEATPGSKSFPLILLGQPGGPMGLSRMYPRLAGRARREAVNGFASATIELPGSGDRTPVPAFDQARTDLQRAIRNGEPVTEEVIDRLVLPLVDTAVPECQELLDVLLKLPDITGPVGFSGGVISVGIRLAVVEPRIKAATLFAGTFVPRAIVEEARRVTIPLHVLLQWDDENNDRQAALDLFDAFGSKEKSLHANMGGHAGVPLHAAEDSAGFFARHLSV
jgi:hypothetical protein